MCCWRKRERRILQGYFHLLRVLQQLVRSSIFRFLSLRFNETYRIGDAWRNSAVQRKEQIYCHCVHNVIFMLFAHNIIFVYILMSSRWQPGEGVLLCSFPSFYLVESSRSKCLSSKSDKCLCIYSLRGAHCDVMIQSNCQQTQIEIYSIRIGSEFVKKISFQSFFCSFYKHVFYFPVTEDLG